MFNSVFTASRHQSVLLPVVSDRLLCILRSLEVMQTATSISCLCYSSSVRQNIEIVLLGLTGSCLSDFSHQRSRPSIQHPQSAGNLLTSGTGPTAKTRATNVHPHPTLWPRANPQTGVRALAFVSQVWLHNTPHSPGSHFPLTSCSGWDALMSCCCVPG